jgi:putative transposase
VLDVVHAPEYVDSAPHTVYARLLDDGIYLASVSTFYRLLRKAGGAWARRDELVHPAYARPELLATKPCEVWSWDVTKIMDRPSRRISTCTSFSISSAVADRGASMRSKPVADLLADLGVIKSHSRPYDDNPYSESHFKTMKYRPNFPDRFHSIEEARAFCQS